MSRQLSWDNTTLFIDDDPGDRAFRQEVRDWIAQNLPAELCNRSVRIDPPELKPWHRKLYERGWIAPHWPKEYGGMGATLTQQIILFEEISRVGAPTPYPHGLNFIGPLIIDAGTPEQQAKHLPPILTGETTWCQGYSKSGAGSDLASLVTRAEPDGDDFIVNGHKMWTTNGHFADWMFALVRTDPKAQPRHAGISMLLIDLKSSGITVRPIQTIRGDAEFAEEFFVDVRVPRDNLLGELNDGWKVANRLLVSLHHAPSTTLLDQGKVAAHRCDRSDNRIAPKGRLAWPSTRREHLSSPQRLPRQYTSDHHHRRDSRSASNGSVTAAPGSIFAATSLAA